MLNYLEDGAFLTVSQSKLRTEGDGAFVSGTMFVALLCAHTQQSC